MPAPAKPAKSFSISSYNQTAFSPFTIDAAQGRAKTPRQMPTRPTTAKSVAKSFVVKEQPKSVRRKINRELVPHDHVAPNVCHMSVCANSRGRATDAMAYSTRSNNSTLGRSNRFPFLKGVRDDYGSSAAHPAYPPLIGGKSHRAIGLYMGGAPASDRILDVLDIFGNPRTLDRKSKAYAAISTEPDIPLYQAADRALSKATACRNYPAAPRAIQQIMQTDGLKPLTEVHS